MSGRGNVGNSSKHGSGAAGRYANALFELADEAGKLDEAERDLVALGEALAASGDLRRLTRSPVYGRAAQARAMEAVADAMGLAELVGKTVGLLAAKGRLFMLGDVIGVFARLMAEHRGEVTAEVTAARKMSDTQRAALARTLKEAVGREVKLDVTVDEAIIGGLVVKVGSKMVDSSIRSRLAALRNAMREVG
ncbi:MAG TPA: F0F1 ATP synthase subunit delta [Thermohalobaculum sp.]|nr:F0F1 ATP synthase subunit delta [Thermohalobaculum sp.]